MARRSAIVLSVTATLVAIGVALLASPASAVTEYKFKLFEKQSFHGVENPSGELSKGFRYNGEDVRSAESRQPCR